MCTLRAHQGCASIDRQRGVFWLRRRPDHRDQLRHWHAGHARRRLAGDRHRGERPPTCAARRSPLGTENNGNFETSEPYEDIGLDGIARTCQHGWTPPNGIGGCYDFGEGDGTWTLSPNVANWYESDVIERLSALTDEQRAHVSMWFDAGIRDFLNASVSSNAGVAQAQARWSLPFGIYDNFSMLDGGTNDAASDFLDVP